MGINKNGCSGTMYLSTYEQLRLNAGNPFTVERELASMELKKIRVPYVIFIVITAFTIVISFSSFKWENSTVKTLFQIIGAILFIVLLATWGISIYHKILSKNIRFYLIMIAVLMLFWQFVLMYKKFLVWGIPDLERFLWYCYYIPLLLIPLFSYYVSLCIGRNEEFSPMKKHKFFFAIAALLILSILTNDFHQGAFVFHTYPAESNKYFYGPLYFAAVAWIIFWMVTALIGVIKKSKSFNCRKNCFLPFIPIILGIIYTILYIMRIPIIFRSNMTHTLCIINIAIWEICISTGILRSNMHYKVCLTGAPLAVQIVGNDGLIYYRSSCIGDVEKIKRKEAIGSETKLDENTLLKAKPIHGGYVFWQEDVTELNILLNRLEESSRQLKEINIVLKDEMHIRKKRIGLEEKNRLYNKMMRETLYQTEKLEKLIDGMKSGHTSMRSELARINVIGTYLKRRNNLFLISEEESALPSQELVRCISESVERLKDCGINCELVADVTGNLPTVYAISIYDLFQEIAEKCNAKETTMLINLKIEDSCISFIAELTDSENGLNLPDENWRKQKFSKLNAALTVERSEGVYRLTLKILQGGDDE